MGHYCQLCNASIYGTERAIRGRRCQYCTAVLPPPKPGGRLQRYCNRACRDAAYYRRSRGDTDLVNNLLTTNVYWQEQSHALIDELRDARAEIARLTALVMPTAEASPPPRKRTARRQPPMDVTARTTPGP